MTTLLNCRLADGSLATITYSGEKLTAVTPQPTRITPAPGALRLEDLSDQAGAMVDAAEALILPAALDVHIHSRDPGLTHKEDWAAVARGGFKGGVVAVCDMPNTKPATMTRETVREKARLAAATGIDFGIYLGVGASNINAIGDLLSDRSLPLCGLKVYYGQSTGDLMYADLEALGRAMPKDDLGRMIVFHSEDQCCIDRNKSKIAATMLARPKGRFDFRAHSEIRASEAAHASTRTILSWAKGYGRPIHIAHLSTPVELELIAEARAQGVQVTSEVAPHHVLFSTDDYEQLGPRIKINPPVRSPEEVRQLRQLIGQGAVECFATDHAPHTLTEKTGDIDSCPSGAPALEYFYPLLAQVAAVSGLPFERAVAMGSAHPARLFGFAHLGQLEPGRCASFVWAAATDFFPSDKEVVSKCGWTPYHGMKLPLKVVATWHRGRRVYRQD